MWLPFGALPWFLWGMYCFFSGLYGYLKTTFRVSALQVFLFASASGRDVFFGAFLMMTMPFIVSLLLAGTIVFVGVVGPDPPLTGLPNPMPLPLATSVVYPAH